MRNPRIRRRPDRRIPALVVSLALIALGGLGVWWSASALFEGQPLAGVQRAENLTWASGLIIATASIIVVSGLLLVLCALVPGRAAVVNIDSTEWGPGRNTVVTTRGLARMAEAEAERTEGTVDAKAQGRPRRVDLRVGTVAPEAKEVRMLLAGRVTERFRALSLKRVPRVAVHTRGKEKR